MEQKTSNAVYIAKAFAVLSIVSAHCAYVSENSCRLNLFASRLLNSFGSIGVGIFLLFAGYFMSGTKLNIREFFLKKAKSLAVPWLFCGTLVYFYVYLRSGGISIKSWILWVLGDQTYLYYMTVLCLLYFICFFFRKNRIVLFAFIFVSVISNVLTALGLLDGINPYLNPFNFLVYFCIGLLIANYGFLEKFFSFSKKYLLLFISAFVLLFLITAYLEIGISYFKLYFIPVEVLAFLTVSGIAYKFSNNELLRNIGKASFAIYMLHMPIAGITANIFGKVDFFLLTLLRPFIVLITVYAAIKLLTFVVKNRKASGFIYTLIGMR